MALKSQSNDQQRRRQSAGTSPLMQSPEEILKQQQQQRLFLPINNGCEEPGETLVTDFATDLFVGTLLVRINHTHGTTRHYHHHHHHHHNNNKSTGVDYFNSRSRRFAVVVHGRFLQPLPWVDCRTGFCLERPCGRPLPPPLLVSSALAIIRLLAPQLAADVEGRFPHVLMPLGSTPQSIIVHDNNKDDETDSSSSSREKKQAKQKEEKDDNDDDQSSSSSSRGSDSAASSAAADLRYYTNHVAEVNATFGSFLESTDLGEPTTADQTLLYQTPHCVVNGGTNPTANNTYQAQQFANLSPQKRASKRKQAFDEWYYLANDRTLTTDPSKTYTFEFLQHLFNYPKLKIELGRFLGGFSFRQLLSGQPLQIMAQWEPIITAAGDPQSLLSASESASLRSLSAVSTNSATARSDKLAGTNNNNNNISKRNSLDTTNTADGGGGTGASAAEGEEGNDENNTNHTDTVVGDEDAADYLDEDGRPLFGQPLWCFDIWHKDLVKDLQQQVAD